MKIMKAIFAILCLQFIGASAISAQVAQPAPGGSSAKDSSVADVTAQRDADTKICVSAAIDSPAAEYCGYFAVVLTGNQDQKKSALTAIGNAYTDPVRFTNAYSTYKMNLALNNSAQSAASNIVSGTEQKAAVNNGQTKQAGSPAASNGSTSLVAKAAATNLLAVAVESGALTQGQTGNTITLQANPGSIFRDAYLRTPQLSYLPVGGSPLDSFTVSVGIAANASSTATVPTTGSATSSPVNTANVLLNSSATKLSSLTVNYEFRRLTQNRIKAYLVKKKLHYLSVPPDTFTKAVDDKRVIFQNDFNAEPPSGCDADAFSKITESGTPVSQQITDFIRTFDSCFGQEADAAIKKNPNLDADASAYNQALLADIASFQKNLNSQISGWDLAAQYVFNKPVNQPETHDFRLIGSGDIKKSAGAAWTVNGAASIYQDLPAGAQYGRLKDAQFSGELDKSWGTGTSAPVIALAGYGQYQSKPSVLNITASSVPSGITLPANSQVFLTGTQGWLGVFQIKTTVRVAGSQIPIAVKWSNKPDLLGKNKLGAQFGVNYDFSQLKQLIGQGSSN